MIIGIGIEEVLAGTVRNNAGLKKIKEILEIGNHKTNQDNIILIEEIRDTEGIRISREEIISEEEEAVSRIREEILTGEAILVMVEIKGIIILGISHKINPVAHPVEELDI